MARFKTHSPNDIVDDVVDVGDGGQPSCNVHAIFSCFKWTPNMDFISSSQSPIWVQQTLYIHCMPCIDSVEFENCDFILRSITSSHAHSLCNKCISLRQVPYGFRLTSWLCRCSFVISHPFDASFFLNT